MKMGEGSGSDEGGVRLIGWWNQRESGRILAVEGGVKRGWRMILAARGRSQVEMEEESDCQKEESDREVGGVWLTEGEVRWRWGRSEAVMRGGVRLTGRWSQRESGRSQASGDAHHQKACTR